MRPDICVFLMYLLLKLFLLLGQVSTFLRKCKKGQIPQIWICPSSIINQCKMVATEWLPFLGLCELDDISHRFGQFRRLQEIEGFMIKSKIIEYFE